MHIFNIEIKNYLSQNLPNSRFSQNNQNEDDKPYRKISNLYN